MKLLRALVILASCCVAWAGTSIDPRRPAVPVGKAANPIDLFLARYFQQHGITRPQPASDAVFARRVYLDLWGLLPTPEQFRTFSSDTRPDKRQRLVRELLANHHTYAEHWISFWNDLLRNEDGVMYSSVRESIGKWLFAALESNLPYDRFAAALLHPTAPTDPKGFLIGVNWRGDVSASQIPAMQAAQNSAQIFLGVNLKCNSCHDSFISTWKLADAYGLASFFSEAPLDVYRCDKPTGKKAELKFLYPQLGTAPVDAPLAEREAVAARLFTDVSNGRFARTFVNRIWARFFGRGIVPQVDDLDGKPFDADLLDWLASDFADHQFDMQFLMERIITSEAYQSISVAEPERAGGDYVFRGPHPRRLTAEQFVDAICAITGEWPILLTKKAEPGSYGRQWKFKSSPLTRALGRPNRDQVNTERSSGATMLQALEVMNGASMTMLLQRGAQRMLGVLPKAPENVFDSGVVGLGGVPAVKVDIDISRSKRLILLVQDAAAFDPSRTVAAWAGAELAGPSGSISLTGKRMSVQFKDQPSMEGIVMPLDSSRVEEIAGKGFQRFRATVGVDNAGLTSEVQARARFFVFDEEPDMQKLVRVAGDPPVPFIAWKRSADEITSQLFEYALLREPSAKERQVARGFLTGADGKLSSDGLEDLLWSTFLLAEFQYVQ
jgi:hypothetical protein